MSIFLFYPEYIYFEQNSEKYFVYYKHLCALDKDFRSGNCQKFTALHTYLDNIWSHFFIPLKPMLGGVGSEQTQ